MKVSSIRFVWAAACVAGAATVGCPSQERAPTAERSPTAEPSPPEESSPVDDLLLHLSEHEDVVVTVTTGTEHFGKGLVALSVHGNGKIEIANRRGGTTTTHHGELTTAQVEELGRSFSKAGFTTVQTSGPPRKPGDTPVVFEVRRGNQQLFRRELWHGDRYQQSGLDQILNRSDNIVSETTNGELPF